MSSDLTFFTNEPGRSLRDRFHALLGEHTLSFDCLVGYFYLSGFHQISSALEKVEKVRILIGLKTNQAAYDLIQQAARQRELDFVSHAEAKERLPQEILDELDKSNDSTQVEEGIGKLQGGALAMQTPYVSQLPIAKTSPEQHAAISKLVDYILFLKANTSENESRDQLMASYFEQIIDALVYELYLPDEIHAAGKEFFAPLLAERLPALAEIKGDKLSALRQIFERLFHKDHVIRQNIFFLDTIESVRIIEGKA